MPGVKKTRQLITKPANAAVTEMKLLRPGEDFVMSAITAALSKGRSKINQGSSLIPLELQRADVLDVRCLPRPIKRDDDGETDRHFRRGDGDDEKDEDLGVVARQSRRGHPKPRESDE